MFWIAIALIIISRSYFSLQKEHFKEEKQALLRLESSDKKIYQLQEENARLEERIRNLEYIVSDKKDYIDIQYEKEERRLDYDQQKFEY